jgi:hypothetical protein
MNQKGAYEEVKNYQDPGCLLPSTQFVTFDVTDLYTMISRDRALEDLGRFLVNGYPPEFLQRYFNRFFRLNQTVQVSTELDAQQYQRLHQKLLCLPTRREKKYQRIADSELHTKELYENEDQLDKKAWNKKILFLPHTFESDPLLNFKRELRELWTKSYVYRGSVMKDVRLMMTTLSNPSLNDLLVHKKPSRLLLTKMGAPPIAKQEDEHEQEF